MLMNLQVDLARGEIAFREVGRFDAASDNLTVRGVGFADGTSEVPSDRALACSAGYQYDGLRRGCVACVLQKCPPGGNRRALTWDDGPSPKVDENGGAHVDQRVRYWRAAMARRVGEQLSERARPGERVSRRR